MRQPVWGWGGWNRARAINEVGKVATTDALWIITFGNSGGVALAALTLMLLLPIMLAMHDFPPGTWTHPRVAPVIALALLLVLYMMDHLMNGMVNPIFMLATGALSSVHVWARQHVRGGVVPAAAGAGPGYAQQPPQQVSPYAAATIRRPRPAPFPVRRPRPMGT
jgi:hypothetical protein